MRTTLLGLSAVLLVACSGGGSSSNANDKEEEQPAADDNATTTTPSRTSGNAVDQCSGAFRCSSPHTATVDTNLTRVAGECRAGAFRLTKDGRAIGEDNLLARWVSTDAHSFDICVDDDCLRCTSTSTQSSPAPARSKGKCTGEAHSCANHSGAWDGASKCIWQQGCTLVREDDRKDAYGQTIFSYRCEGTAKSCSAIDYYASCNEAPGCRWEP